MFALLCKVTNSTLRYVWVSLITEIEGDHRNCNKPTTSHSLIGLSNLSSKLFLKKTTPALRNLFLVTRGFHKHSRPIIFIVIHSETLFFVFTIIFLNIKVQSLKLHSETLAGNNVFVCPSLSITLVKILLKSIML